MQVTVENPGGLQRRLTVQVPGEEVQQQITNKLRELGKTAKMAGFRPGRIPMSVLQQRYGASVRNEVVGQTMQRSLFEAIQQESLRPASNPVIEEVNEGTGEEDFSFTATIEIYPEIDKIDAGSITVNTPQAEVADADIDDMIETLREQRAVWDPVERKGAEGDQVSFDYVADVDGETIPAEGKKKMALVLGTTDLDKLEKALAKMEAGDTSTVKQDFPEAFAEPALSGAKAKLDLEVTVVKEKKLPEVDAEFIKSFAIESGEMDEMRSEVRNNLERELSGARLTFLKMQVLDALLGANESLEVPEGMVRDEAASLVQRQAQQLGVEPDMSHVDNFMDIARKRVKSALLLGEVARQNDILVDGARVREAIETIAQTYEQSREVVQMYYQNQEMLSAVESSVLEEQVVDWVLENAKVSETPMGFKELIEAATAARQGS